MKEVRKVWSVKRYTSSDGWTGVWITRAMFSTKEVAIKSITNGEKVFEEEVFIRPQKKKWGKIKEVKR